MLVCEVTEVAAVDLLGRRVEDHSGAFQAVLPAAFTNRRGEAPVLDQAPVCHDLSCRGWAVEGSRDAFVACDAHGLWYAALREQRVPVERVRVSIVSRAITHAISCTSVPIVAPDLLCETAVYRRRHAASDGGSGRIWLERAWLEVLLTTLIVALPAGV